MPFHVTNEQGKPLMRQSLVPENLKEFEVEGAAPVLFSDDNLQLLYFSIPLHGCSITYLVFNAKRVARYHFYSDLPSLDMHLLVENRQHINASRFGSYEVAANQFNLRYQPYLDTFLDVNVGITRAFSINYSPGYLRRYVAFFAPIESFLKCVDKQQAAHLSKSYMPFNEDILHILDDILGCTHTDKTREVFMSAKALELLNLCIHQSGLKTASMPLTPADEERVLYIRELIGNKFDEPPSLTAMARMVGTNEQTLQRIYKQYYGTTIFDQVLQLKMDKAFRLLVDSRTRIKEIGYQLGYQSIQTFSKAFRKHYGQAPSEVRKFRC